MYTSPEIITYSDKELLDFMGPVETQYCTCELVGVDAQPDSFLVGKSDIPLSANVSACPNFQTVQVSLIDPNGVRLSNDTFNRSQGVLMGGTWVLDPYVFPIVPSAGDYMIEVTLIEAPGCSSRSAFTSFTVM